MIDLGDYFFIPARRMDLVAFGLHHRQIGRLFKRIRDDVMK